MVIQDQHGRQPAHLAVMRNHANIIEFLYDIGVDLDCMDQVGKNPLHYSAQYGGE